MRIGLYISGISRDVGGGYTFQHDIFRAFVNLAHERVHEFVALGDHANFSQYVASLIPPSNVKTIGLTPAHLKDRIIEGINRTSPMLKRVLKTPGRIARAAMKCRLDCLWYVGGGGYEATDIPYIATVWDLEHRLQPWFPELSADGEWDSRELSYRNFLQRASYVLVGTEAGRDEVQMFYQVPAARIRILPHPTPRFALDGNGLTAEATRRKFRLPESYLLYPAQFWPHKNHANLLGALKYLRDRYGKTPALVLVGSDKGIQSYIRRLVEEYKLSEQVIFLGFVELQDLIGLYRGALMLVYVSMCGPENLPPLEAFALGCPVVATDIPGAREQLGEAATLVLPGDPESIATGIKQVWEDAALRARLVLAGHARARKWTARDYVQGVFEFLDRFEPIIRCWRIGL